MNIFYKAILHDLKELQVQAERERQRLLMLQSDSDKLDSNRKVALIKRKVKI